jgi:hypothetical protein
MFFRCVRTLCATLVCAFLTPAVAARAQAGASIAGSVLDAATGVGISGALVRLVGADTHTTTDARGRFSLSVLRPGSYRLSVQRDGYQPAVSPLVQTASLPLTLTLVRASEGLHVIAVTSTSRAASLQRSSTYTVTLNNEQLLRDGIVRVADALRGLPGVNNGITGDTAALGDDVNLDIRGIGETETIAALDGHPIGYGIKGGYNYQLSPVFPFRNTEVLYGSGGSDILGVDAIGGIVNFQTLDPTPSAQVAATQGYGTFGRLASSMSATGSAGKLGYALAYGVAGLDGPFRNDSFYQPGAAFDASAPVGSSTYDRAIYVDDSSVTSRAALAKFRYDVDPSTSVTFTNVNESYWENKTGNGDGDYLPSATALARGEQQLKAYDAQTSPSVICPSGSFAATTNGHPDAYSVGGLPAGCQTPSIYASLTAGWQGVGPAWQAFNFGYQDLDMQHRAGAGVISLDGFTTLYDDTQFRENLPYDVVPGDTEKETFDQVKSTGSILSDEFAGRNNDVQAGYSYLNNVYVYRTIRYASMTQTFPVTSEDAYFLRDVYHSERSPLTAYFNLWAKHATATNSSYLDERLSIVDHITPRDVVRAAAGATTTQPSSDEIDQPFLPTALAEGTLQGAGGGQTYVCGGLNSIGAAPSSVLKPERGVDEEVAYGHSWSGDSITQLQLYNVNVYDKLYSTIAPISLTGSNGIDPAYIANATTALNGVCGMGNYQLGVTGTLNVGTLRAQGGDLSGRWRLTRGLFLDYDWALTSTVLMNAPASFLESNLTEIVGSQIPRVPLHAFSGSIDDTFGNGFNVRYTLHAVSAGNTKSLPAYDYSDLRVSHPVGTAGTLTVTVSNLFNQWANIAGLIGEGQPLPLNSYAKTSDYASYVGSAATEAYGLPYRQIYFSFQWRT